MNIGPEWHISTMICSRDTPFWSETLELSKLQNKMYPSLSQMEGSDTPLLFIAVEKTDTAGQVLSLVTGEVSHSHVHSQTRDRQSSSKTSSTRLLLLRNRLVGLLVRRPPRERKIPGSNPTCDRIFSGWSHTSDLKIGTPVATLPGAWRYRVRAGTGRPGVSIL